MLSCNLVTGQVIGQIKASWTKRLLYMYLDSIGQIYVSASEVKASAVEIEVSTGKASVMAGEVNASTTVTDIVPANGRNMGKVCMLMPSQVVCFSNLIHEDGTDCMS